MKIRKSQLKQIIKEELEIVLNETGGPAEQEPSKKMYTIGEFRRHVARARQKVAAQKGTTAVAKGSLSLGSFGMVQSTQEFAKGFKELAELVNNPGFGTPETQQYIENPILHYIDFDPAYEAVLNGAVFDAFMDQLGEQLLKNKLTDGSEMPDIDHLLEDWLREIGYNGHKLDLDGALDANIAYARTAGEGDPLAGTPAKKGKSWWDRTKEFGQEVVVDPLKDIADVFSGGGAGYQSPKHAPGAGLRLEELRRIIEEEIDGFTGLSDAWAAKEWINEYGEQIARIFIDNGAYGLAMAEDIGAPAEIIAELKKIMYKVAKMLRVAETSNWNILPRSGRPESYVHEINRDLRRMMRKLAPDNEDLIEQADTFTDRWRSPLYHLIEYATAVMRGWPISDELADSYEVMEKWVGEDHTLQAIHNRKKAK
mgnify:CR=1 FL=1